MLVSGDLLLILYTHRKGESLSLRFRKSEAFFCGSLIGRSVREVMYSVERYLRLRPFGIFFSLLTSTYLRTPSARNPKNILKISSPYHFPRDPTAVCNKRKFSMKDLSFVS